LSNLVGLKLQSFGGCLSRVGFFVGGDGDQVLRIPGWAAYVGAGFGTEKNPQAGYDSLLAAVQAGDQRAQELLPSVERMLSAEQVERAKAQVRSGQKVSTAIRAKSMSP
jgi:hypothetical protein